MGLLILLGGSKTLVWGATEIARYFGVSELIIGLTIVAVGTSLPELAASVASALKNKTEMADKLLIDIRDKINDLVSKIDFVRDNAERSFTELYG